MSVSDERIQVYRKPLKLLPRPTRDLRRLENLEDRVFEQERTTQALIEKAFELKEKISDQIEPTTMDVALQQLWHEHIRTITSTVRQLHRDLDAVKHELSLRRNQAVDASHHTHNIETFTQAGMADLRGRVVRCDTSIARLVHDMHSMTSSSQMEAEKLKQAADTNKSKVSQMENQLIELTRRIDTLMTEQNGKLQNMQGSNTQQMEEIDLKIKRILEDIRMTVDSNRRWAEGERMRIEQQLMQIVELNNSVAQTKQESFESKIMDRLEVMQRNIDDCREENKKCKEELKEKAEKTETNRRIDQQRTRVEAELARLKNEYRDGFASVKESINTTNQLVNGKVKLVKEELSRDISNVKKMVVLI